VVKNDVLKFHLKATLISINSLDEQSSLQELSLLTKSDDNYDQRICKLESLISALQSSNKSLNEELDSLKCDFISIKERLASSDTNVHFIFCVFSYSNDFLFKTHEIVGRHRTVVTHNDLQTAIIAEKDIKGFAILASMALKINYDGKIWSQLNNIEKEKCEDLMGK
jgi:hypothetical protein